MIPIIFHLSLLNVSVFWKLHISLRCNKYSIMSILYLKKWSHLETTDWNNIFKYFNVTPRILNPRLRFTKHTAQQRPQQQRIRIPVHYRNLDKSQMRTLFVFLYIKIWKEKWFTFYVQLLWWEEISETYECLSWFRKNIFMLYLNNLNVLYVDKNTIPQHKSRDI